MATGAGSRHYREADLKKLFALSYNECAHPACEQQLARPEWPRTQCQISHIYGLNPGSARYIAQMTDQDRNAYENLMLFCPNHHNLVDYLEPHNYPADNLADMKWAHERRRGERRNWCPEPLLDEYVRKLAYTLNLIVLSPGERPPIRSSGRAVEVDDVADGRGTMTRPRRRKNVRVHELATELNMMPEDVLELAWSLGVPVKTRGSTMNEAYADMVSRRAIRDGMAQVEPQVAAALGIGSGSPS